MEHERELGNGDQGLCSHGHDTELEHVDADKTIVQNIEELLKCVLFCDRVSDEVVSVSSRILC